MTFYDPWEHTDDEGRNEWAVRDQLWAKSYLRDLEAGKVDAAEKNRKMLAAVVPKAQVCCYSRVEKTERDGETKKRTVSCRAPGVRMVAVTGDWFCAEHDPLRPCPASEDGWRCSSGYEGHGGWPHRFRTLKGEG